MSALVPRLPAQTYGVRFPESLPWIRDWSADHFIRENMRPYSTFVNIA